MYGFVLTELKLPFAAADGAEEFASELDVPADTYPYLAELIGELVIGKDYSFADEFGYGLGLILDELENRRSRVEH